jgi:iron complex outermembrane receptor protein/vitamin B12 transporter
MAVLSAQEAGTLSGQVVDTLGARIAGASVTLTRGGVQAGESTSNGEGVFTFSNLAPGRYQVTATAPGFQPRTTDPMYAGPGTRASVDVVLEVGPLQQDVVVTAEAGQVLQSQTGAPVTVIDNQMLEALNKPDLAEALRLVPGAQIVQVGERGGATSLFLRGGNSNFTKVLIDGMAANDIGGGYDFSQLDTAGVDRLEVLRQTNSVRYGSDALTGVVNISTRRGSARVPEFQYGIDAGNLRTFRNSISLGGAVRRYDYFSQYSYYTTDNHTPDSGYHRSTYAGRFGVAVGSGTNVSGTLRWLEGEFGTANGFSLFGIADDVDHGGLADHRSLAEHDPLRVGGPHVEVRQSGAHWYSVRSVRVRRELSWRHRHVDGCQRRNGHRPGHPRFRRHLPRDLRQPYDAALAFR